MDTPTCPLAKDYKKIHTFKDKETGQVFQVEYPGLCDCCELRWLLPPGMPCVAYDPINKKEFCMVHASGATHIVYGYKRDKESDPQAHLGQMLLEVEEMLHKQVCKAG